MSRYYEALAKSLVAVVMLGAASLAHAHDGFYVSLQGGGSFLSDADFKDLGLDGVPRLETEFDPGFNVGGSVGVAFANNFRIEAEVNFAQNDIDEFTLVGGSLVAGDGDVDSLAFMGNAFYDFVIRPLWQAYVGGGAGVAIVSVNDAAVFGTLLPVADDEDTVFAYQAGAGIGYAFSPSTTLTLDYRFFATEDPDFKDVIGDSFEAEYSRHDIRVGVRFRFGAER